MKKIYWVSLVFIFLMGLAGCSKITTKDLTSASTTITTLNQAPVFSGVVNVSVEKDSTAFNLLDGITVSDVEDGDLTSVISVQGQVDITVEGEYPISLTVIDSANNEVNASFVVTVTPLSDEKQVLADIDAFVLSLNSDGNYVLPTSGSVNKSSISWTSSHKSVVSSSGFVMRPGIGEDSVTVTLNATFKKGTFTKTTPFQVVIEGNHELNGVTSSVLLPFEGTSEEYVVANQSEVRIFFADKGSLPYIDVETFINLIDGAIDSSIVEITPIDDDKLKIEYSVEYEDFDGSLVTDSFWALIDFTENTFTVNNFSFFENYVAETSSDYGEGLNYVDADYIDGEEVTIPLGYYNFDLLIHSEDEVDFYLMPLHIANLLFAGGIYYDVYYNGDKLWGIDTFTISGPDEAGELLLNDIRTSSFNSLTAPKDVRWATYNFMCLALDYFYGLKEDRGVESYHEEYYFSAKEIVTGTDSVMYRKIFDWANQLDDLHTSHIFTGFYEQPYHIQLYINDLATKTKKFYNGLWSVQDAFDIKFGGTENIPTEARLIDNNKTAIIYITGFEIETPDWFKTIMDGLPSEVENVVIDLAYNTGGNLGAVLRIFGYMTENPIVYHSQNPADGAAVSYYIESDYVAYDYNWFIVTSSVTFSAANLMASIAKEQHIATVIGKNSSGGASSIGTIIAPNGSCLLISTNNVLSTVVGEQYLSIENGIEVEYRMDNVTDDQALLDIIALVNSQVVN